MLHYVPAESWVDPVRTTWLPLSQTPSVKRGLQQLYLKLAAEWGVYIQGTSVEGKGILLRNRDRDLWACSRSSAHVLKIQSSWPALHFTLRLKSTKTPDKDSYLMSLVRQRWSSKLQLGRVSALSPLFGILFCVNLSVTRWNTSCP